MSNASALAALEYEPETNFAENVSTFTAHRIPTATAIDVSGLKHDKVDSGRVVQRLQDGSPSILGVQGGTIKVKIHAAGHGSSCASATTLDAIETCSSRCASATRQSRPPPARPPAPAARPPSPSRSHRERSPRARSAASAPRATADRSRRPTRAATGSSRPSQAHITTNLTLLTAIDAAPNAADVIYSAVNLYLPEDATDATATITGIRLRFLSAEPAL